MSRWLTPTCSTFLILPLTSKRLCCLIASLSQREEGQVAQSVEQRTENPCVGGSIPPLATKKQPLNAVIFLSTVEVSKYYCVKHLDTKNVRDNSGKNSPTATGGLIK